MDKCFKRILVLVNYKERCTEELYQRLVVKENFNEDDFSLAMQKAKKYGIVDDARYAEMYAFNKIQALRGVAGIIKHFQDMKIDYSGMEKVKELIDSANSEEKMTALKFIEKHPSRAKDGFSGNVRKLVNRGFSINSAISAAKEYKNL